MKTVRVPPEMAAIFSTAEDVVSRYFGEWQRRPERGSIEIAGERYVLMRAASLSVEFFDLVAALFGERGTDEADEFSRNILFDLAHAVGKSDAKNFHAKMGLEHPIARLSAGPVHFAHAGWAFVDIAAESQPEPDDRFFLLYDHPYSFESDAWLRAGRRRDFPVCIMNAGYSSGWCEESFGLTLVATEILCRARGDEACRFIMAPPHTIQAHVGRYIRERPAEAERMRAHSIPDFFSRKRAEEEITRLYARLKELDRLKSEFFANVSHDLRTPLTLILGHAERLAGRGELGEPARADLAAVTRNAHALLGQVDDLLDATRLEAGKTAVEWTELDVARFLGQVAARFEVIAQARRIVYRVDLPASLEAQVDAAKTERILVNLLANAFKFAPEGGEVRCTLRAEPEGIVLTVGDSGLGVPPAWREDIFERFVTLGRGRESRFAGTGLGLPIARQLARLQGGDVVVEDAPEGGALFVLRLPGRAPGGIALNPPPAPPDAAEAEARVRALVPRRVPVAPPAGEPGRPRVLVVEDDPEMAGFLADVLVGPYEVALASDGEAGLAHALAQTPDLVVTDVMMPRMAGPELVQALRDAPATAEVPILVLSAKADEKVRVELLQRGAQDYVMKPFSTAELLARAANLVAAGRARRVLREALRSQTSDLAALAEEAAADRRRAETALAALDVAREEAERRGRAKGDLLRLVSHELRGPLTTIQLQAEILRRDASAPLTELQGRTVERLILSRKRLTALIDDLLEYARVDGGHLEVRAGEVELTALVREVTDELRPHAEHKQIALTLDAPSGEQRLATDARLVRLVLANLIGNAIKFTERGEVTVSSGFQGGWWRCAVADTGPGIPDEERERIFRPFEQLEPLSHKHAPGVGLGLALCQQLASALGGEIELDSRPGRGSTFGLRLPPGVGQPPRRPSTA